MLSHFIHLKLKLRIFAFTKKVQHADSAGMFTFSQLLRFNFKYVELQAYLK